MSKQKKVRRVVLDKLFNKNETFLKQSTRSNAPTQSTPNQPKNMFKVIQTFFQNFQTECAIIYQPVKLTQHRPIKRSLQQQLTSLFKNNKSSKLQSQQFPGYLNFDNICTKNSSSVIDNRKKPRIYERINTENCGLQQTFKQKSVLNTYAQNQPIFRSKSMVFNTKPSNQFRPEPRPKISEIDFNQKLNLLYQKIQKLKTPYRSTVNLLEKEKQQKFVTNSKNIKQSSKNIPKKIIQRPQKPQAPKMDRIKRIQSLKNLNQNGIRKYSYKKDL